MTGDPLLKSITSDKNELTLTRTDTGPKNYKLSGKMWQIRCGRQRQKLEFLLLPVICCIGDEVGKQREGGEGRVQISVSEAKKRERGVGVKFRPLPPFSTCLLHSMLQEQVDTQIGDIICH